MYIVALFMLDLAASSVDGSVFQKYNTMAMANCPTTSSSDSNFTTTSSGSCTADVEEYPMYSIVFECPEDALELSDCPSFSADSCESGKEAGVVCHLPCEDGGTQLVGGSTDLEGNVQVCINGVWGTVCDPSWGAPEAKVVCTSLGYSQLGKDAILFKQSLSPMAYSSPA